MAADSSNPSSMVDDRSGSGSSISARSQHRLHSLNRPSSSSSGAAMQLISAARARSCCAVKAHSIAARTLPISGAQDGASAVPGCAWRLAWLRSCCA
ncbi:hypothetical protein D9M70_552820 [compost metagenome]